MRTMKKIGTKSFEQLRTRLPIFKYAFDAGTTKAMRTALLTMKQKPG